ncbi:hypothetical protein HDU97_008230 [Phlyctochytrium planicorne]|nr:hypothetical protein HDU97_008230 [Phlyctochytrium planicorne]
MTVSSEPSWTARLAKAGIWSVYHRTNDPRVLIRSRLRTNPSSSILPILERINNSLQKSLPPFKPTESFITHGILFGRMQKTNIQKKPSASPTVDTRLWASKALAIINHKPPAPRKFRYITRSLILRTSQVIDLNEALVPSASVKATSQIEIGNHRLTISAKRLEKLMTHLCNADLIRAPAMAVVSGEPNASSSCHMLIKYANFINNEIITITHPVNMISHEASRVATIRKHFVIEIGDKKIMISQKTLENAVVKFLKDYGTEVVVLNGESCKEIMAAKGQRMIGYTKGDSTIVKPARCGKNIVIQVGDFKISVTKNAFASLLAELISSLNDSASIGRASTLVPIEACDLKLIGWGCVPATGSMYSIGYFVRMKQNLRGITSLCPVARTCHVIDLNKVLEKSVKSICRIEIGDHKFTISLQGLEKLKTRLCNVVLNRAPGMTAVSGKPKATSSCNMLVKSTIRNANILINEMITIASPMGMISHQASQVATSRKGFVIEVGDKQITLPQKALENLLSQFLKDYGTEVRILNAPRKENKVLRGQRMIGYVKGDYSTIKLTRCSKKLSIQVGDFKISVTKRAFASRLAELISSVNESAIAEETVIPLQARDTKLIGWEDVPVTGSVGSLWDFVQAKETFGAFAYRTPVISNSILYPRVSIESPLVERQLLNTTTGCNANVPCYIHRPLYLPYDSRTRNMLAVSCTNPRRSGNVKTKTSQIDVAKANQANQSNTENTLVVMPVIQLEPLVYIVAPAAEAQVTIMEPTTSAKKEEDRKSKSKAEKDLLHRALEPHAEEPASSENLAIGLSEDKSSLDRTDSRLDNPEASLKVVVTSSLSEKTTPPESEKIQAQISHPNGLSFHAKKKVIKPLPKISMVQLLPVVTKHNKVGPTPALTEVTPGRPSAWSKRLVSSLLGCKTGKVAESPTSPSFDAERHSTAQTLLELSPKTVPLAIPKSKSESVVVSSTKSAILCCPITPTTDSIRAQAIASLPVKLSLGTLGQFYTKPVKATPTTTSACKGSSKSQNPSTRTGASQRRSRCFGYNSPSPDNDSRASPCQQLPMTLATTSSTPSRQSGRKMPHNSSPSSDFKTILSWRRSL